MTLLSDSPLERNTGAFVINNIQPDDGLGPYFVSISLSGSNQSFDIVRDTIPRNRNGELEVTYQDLPTGSYIIAIENAIGCEIAVGNPFVIPVNTDVIIPNVFTPNGDGTNETFEIINIPGSGNGTEMLITNRWGKVVFESEDYYFNSEGDNSFWDGGDEPEGVYFYTVEIEGDTFKGWVEIIRGQP